MDWKILVLVITKKFIYDKGKIVKGLDSIPLHCKYDGYKRHCVLFDALQMFISPTRVEAFPMCMQKLG